MFLARDHPPLDHHFHLFLFGLTNLGGGVGFFLFNLTEFWREIAETFPQANRELAADVGTLLEAERDSLFLSPSPLSPLSPTHSLSGPDVFHQARPSDPPHARDGEGTHLPQGGFWQCKLLHRGIIRSNSLDHYRGEHATDRLECEPGARI